MDSLPDGASLGDVFTLGGTDAQRALADAGDDVAFADLERRLKAYVTALWRTAPLIKTAERGSPDQPRRAGFEGGIVRMPASFRGVAGGDAATLFRAALAHVAAHLHYGGPKFPVGSLKPVQVALVSLVEDARVEHLAMRDFAGLRRLWLPLHLAAPTGVGTAPALMARLARALIDPGYDDPHHWVAKGRDLFFASEGRWQDPAMSRTIGGLLGNDLGQMRVQFNARTHVVEPPYRDDNLGLWDFGDPGAKAEEETELLLESVRFERLDHETPPEREREEKESGGADEAGRARLAVVDPDSGIPVARYPEWDHLIGRERPDWTTLVEYEPLAGRAAAIDRVLERERPLLDRISALIRTARVSRPTRLRRQAEGDRLDLEAAIAAAIDRRIGLTPDPLVYARQERRSRDLSVLLLLDVSQSTNDIVPYVTRSVLDLEREAAALLAEAMAGLGDPFAIHAFCSDGRSDVRYYRVKDFGAPYDASARRRLAGLTGRFSTRLGAALRHAGRELARQMSYRRLLLVITDGEPSDIDVGDSRYLVEDSRRAVHSLAHAGIDVFCVGLEGGGANYLPRMFGARNVFQIDRLEKLPERLPMLYLRLTT